MTTKKLISAILVLVLISTVFSSFAFATGGGCPPTTIDRTINDTITCDQTYHLWHLDSRLPEWYKAYYFDDIICSPGCGNAEIKWVEQYGIEWQVIEFTPGSTCCCGENTIYVKMKSLFPWWYSSKTVKIVVTVDCPPPNPCEIQPVAVDDSYKTNENTCANFSVLDNDDDKNPKQIIVTKPKYGSAEESGGRIYYCPLGNYCGEDTFTYYYITENDCMSNTATVTVTIPCKTPLPETILYPGIGLERLTIPGGPIPIDGSIGAVLDTGTNIISDGKVVSSLELLPGTQTLLVQVENRGSLTQTDVGVRFEGLPEGVTYNLEPELQKITAHNLGTYILTLTASPNIQPGTYTVKATAYSAMGSLDEIILNIIIK